MKQFVALVALVLISFLGFSQPDPVPYGSNKAVGKFLRINGVNLYYEIYGTGEPILLIHGNGTGIKGWSSQIAHFSKKYQVVAVDCRGRGQSELGTDSLTYIQQASDLAKLLTELKLENVTVIGKSDGAIIGLLMAIYYPGTMKQLVSYGANAEPDGLYPETANGIHSDRVKAEEMLAKGDSTKNWKLEQQKYRMMEFQPHITAEDLKKISIPVLVMSCDRDVIKEEHTFWIYRNIRFSSLSISPGEVHRFPTLNPDLFNSIVGNWISQPFKGEAVRFK
ncbi:MAG: Arylesterase [Fluviicola sp.]|jgi:pimeloyl-ACP methyl ester carboxylesterase|uniref:alpha/beta fold hydrolase n=1 Tax=Fluviicola sp. TaxID=1917219 RepID=UPI00262DF3B4|nr:alpha/beta hydrolase [Fluviicola sp.]MDF3029015.1 Arylesterase [Fluviicola sp.]